MVYYESCLGKTPKLTRKEQLVQKPKSKMNNKYQIHVQMVTQVTNMPLYTSSTVAIFHKLLNLKTVNILCVTQLEIFVQYKHIPLITFNYIFLFVQFLHNIYTQSPENSSFLCWIVHEGSPSKQHRLVELLCIINYNIGMVFTPLKIHLHILYIIHFSLSHKIQIESNELR